MKKFSTVFLISFIIIVSFTNYIVANKIKDELISMLNRINSVPIEQRSKLIENFKKKIAECEDKTRIIEKPRLLPSEPQKKNKPTISKNNNWYGLGQQLPLPRSLRNMPFKYIKSKQQKGWSCGYNCLYNACNIENHFGRLNQNINFANFSTVCLNYLNKKGEKPDKGSTNKMQKKLAKALDLDKFVGLDIKNKLVVPTLDSWVRNANMTSKQAKELAIDNILLDVKNHLGQNGDSTTFVNFFCHVYDSEPHVILVTLVQKPGQIRSFYIFDNTNSCITAESDIFRHIHYIYSQFK